MDTFEDTLEIERHRIERQYNAPGFVKNASAQEVRPDFEDSELIKVCADPVNLCYPCHTKAATWLSAAYFTDAYETLPDHYKKYVGNRLQKFAEFFGIEDEVSRMVSRKTNQIKEAAAPQEYPDDWYLYINRQGGTVKRAGLIATPKDVEASAKWLCENRNTLPLNYCRDIAAKIVKRAGAIGVDVPNQDMLERLLGFGFNDNESIARSLRKRAEMGRTKNARLSDTLSGIADEFLKNPPEVGSPVMRKVANFIDECDNKMGLVALRSRGDLPYPEEIIYRHTVNGLKKEAAAHIRLQNGDVYALDSLSGADRSAFEGTFGSDLSDACFTGMELNKEGAAAVLPTLPRPMADQLSGVLRESGISPVRREKADAALTLDDLP